MSTRSGPEKSIRAAATYTAIDTWYACDETITLYQNGEQLRLYISNTTADCGRVAIKLQVQDMNGNFCDMIGHGGPWQTDDLAVGDCVSMPLTGAALCARDEVKVLFSCSEGAGSAVLEISALAHNSDGGEQPGFSPSLDSSTNAINTMDYQHHEVHSGSHYFIKTWVDITGSGTVTYFGFQTPDSEKQVHAKSILFGEAEFTVEIYEGATVSNVGSPMVEINNNRNSTNIATLEAYAGPTVTDDGTLLWAGKIGSGRGSTGVTLGLGYEIIAKRNSFYLFKLTKETSGTHYVDVDFFWYEHTDKSVSF